MSADNPCCDPVLQGYYVPTGHEVGPPEPVLIAADDVAPSQPFSQGHKRPPEVTAELIAALSKALIARPTWRLGQLLTIVGADRDLWSVWDETWVKDLDAELNDGQERPCGS